MSETVNEEQQQQQQQLYKVLKDFVRDILITFPEYKDKLTQGVIDITLDKTDTEDAKSIYKYCEKYTIF